MAKKLLWAFLIFIGLTACREPEGMVFVENDTLSLVMSIPIDTGRDLNYQHIELTDSLVVTIELIPTGSGSFNLMLCRYPYLDPNYCDTLFLPFNTPDTCFWHSYTMDGHEGYGFDIFEFSGIWSWNNFARMPEPSWILLPFSLGDSSEIIRLGKTEPRLKKTSRPEFYRKQRLYGEYIYLVDVHSSFPRTIGSLRGEAQCYVDPYLLLFTGYKGSIGQSRTDYRESELLVIDLRDLSVAARQPLYTDSDTSSCDPETNGRSTLTPDGRFLLIDRDWNAYNCDYYFPRFNVLISEDALDKMFGSLTYYTRYIIEFHPVFRQHSVERASVLVWDLTTGEKVKKELLIPQGSLYYWRCNFFGADNEVVFISDPPCGIYGPYFLEVPTISNLEGPPLELRWFRRMLPFSFPWRWEVRWMMSKEGRWLVASTSREKGDAYKGTLKTKPGHTYLIPTEELAYPESERKKPNVVTLPLDISPYYFLPGKDWLVVGGCDFRFFRLFHIPDGRLLPLNAKGEVSCRNYYFSPDGQYVAYTCEIEGREGVWLQVRKLPY